MTSHKTFSVGIVCSFLAMAIILFVRGDSFLPLPKTLPTPILMFYVLAHTLLFGAAYAIWSRNFLSTSLPQEGKGSPDLNIGRPMLWLSWVCLILGLLYHVIQSHRFAPLGYHWTHWIWISFGSASFIGMLWLTSRFLKGRLTLFSLASVIFAIVLALRIPPILDFPLTVLRSDMFLNIQACIDDLLKGISPYYHHRLGDFDLPNVRLPAMLVAYLPWSVFHIDLRWGKLLYELASGIAMLCLIRRLPPPKQAAALLLFLIFWTNPYLAFRHDIYDAPFWLLILLVIWTLNPERFWINGLLVGCMGAMHQWGWVAIPFLTIHQFRTLSTRRFTIWIAGCLGILGAVLGPYVIGDFQNFVSELFGNYGMVGALEWKVFPAETGWDRLRGGVPFMTLRPWLIMTDFGYAHSMHLLAGLLAVLWLCCVLLAKRNTPMLVWGVSLGWLLTIWLAPTGWTYQYLTLLFYILAVQIVAWMPSIPSKTARPNIHSQVENRVKKA